MLQTLMAHIYLLGAGQGMFLFGFILLSKRIRNKATAFLLAALLLLFTFNLIYYFLAYSGNMVHMPHLFGTHNSFILLYGPIFYFLLRSLAGQGRPTFKFLLHLLPWLAFLIYLMPLYLLPAEIKIHIYRRDMAQGGFYPPHIIPLLINLALVAHLSIYLVFAFRLVNQYMQHKLLHPVLYAFAGFTTLSIAYHFIHFAGIGYFSIVCYGVKFLMAVIVYSIGYMLFLNGGTCEAPTPKPKYKTSSIDSESSELIAQKIQRLMDEEALYLNPDLSLATLAQRLQLSLHYLSRAVNEHLKCSFNDWVNKQRVDYACTLLKETNETIIAVAYRSGFNNKVTFNNAFKKYIGQTPSAYRDAHTENTGLSVQTEEL